MLQIVTSNRLEHLADRLAGQLRHPLADPFAREVIVVQSKGMQRWLSMALAESLGVWANGDFPFPNEFVWQLFSAVVPDLPSQSPFDPAVLTWRLLDLLPGLLDRPGFEPLRDYLGGRSEPLKRFQLAEKIADTFDQYTLFRPEMLAGWEKGRDDGWQAELWRELSTGASAPHRGQLLARFAGTVQGAGFVPPRAFPDRVALFGISYLPPFHLQVLSLLARHVDVTLYLLSPCAEYWGDLVTARERARLSGIAGLPDEGNPLLASLGRLGRDFADMVLSVAEEASVASEEYLTPGDGTLLSTLQSDILLLRSPAEAGQQQVASDDLSLRVHSCHTPLREIEVLHDQLLDYLAADPTLAPRDILVMTPEIETYAPLIAAVFDGVIDPAMRIPYSIADRSIRRQGHVAETLLALLDLPASRFAVPAVLDILESLPVRQHFGLDDADLDRVRGWLEQTGIRWGLDEDDRARHGLPPFRENSWQAGLDRLLLGFAMPEQGGLFAGILPFGVMEGDGARLLGVLVEFVTRLADAARELGRPRPLAGWAEMVRRLLDGFVGSAETAARELLEIDTVLAGLAECSGLAGFAGEVTPEVFRSWLAARLDRQERDLGFLGGGVTFCAMLPMRSIPFRVIALVGINDGVFPRQNRPPGFDRVARNPRPGDRSLRDEDRYLFLEALLSARDALYLSYVGQGSRDNAELPPAVVVSELLDYLAGRFTVGRGEPGPSSGQASESFVTKQRLQPFSRAYFTGEAGLFSYSAENCQALRDRPAVPRGPLPFLTRPLSLPDEWQELPLAVLLRFFDNPARFFLEQRLGIRFAGLAAPLEGREPFGMEGLAAYQLKQELLEICLAGGDPATFLPVARARGLLPPARHGAALFAGIVAEVSRFAGQVRQAAGALPLLPPLEIDLVCHGVRLFGRLDRLSPDRLLRYRCARLKGRDQWRLWLEHLVLNVAAPAGYSRQSCLVMQDGTVTLAPVADAADHLCVVLERFRQGLCQPLRFFPESSLAYAARGKWDLHRARRAWTGTEYSRGEGDDPCLERCFRGDDPLAGDFDLLARELLTPMQECMQP
jgi:exodeoxyribonuclease V gamma subunit